MTNRPTWGLWGGIAIITGGVLLMIATLIEARLWDDSTPALLAIFTALFLGSTAAHAVAMIPLAGGRTGSDGIVGTSAIGRFALLGFGGLFLTSQTVYYVVTYALAPVDDYSGVLTLTTVVSIGQLALLLVASIIVIRARVAEGAARWAFLALTVVSVITGAIANSTDSAEVATVALLCSTGTQIVVGVVLATTRKR